MRIKKIDLFRVQVPAKPVTWHSTEFGAPGWDEAPILLMKISTDNGIAGYGEVGRGVREVAVRAYSSQLMEVDLSELNMQALPIGDFFDKAAGVYSAYEMALLDILGKARGEPAYKLLGGAYRDRVLVSLCSGQMTPEDAAAKAKEAASGGYRYLKMKATDKDPVVERVAAIQKTVGDEIKIVIDPMQRLWRPQVLFDLCRRLEPYYENIQCFEDPFAKRNLSGYRLARQKIQFPLALHLGSGEDVIEAIKGDACDYLNLGNGIFNFLKTAAIAEAAQIPVWHGSGVGLGVSEAAILHAAAAAKSCTLSSDVVGEKIRENDLIVEPIRFENGYALVPQGPGLGVELDMEAIERYAV